MSDTWPNLPFKVVLQRDRRQIPDRRTVWRGGRRAADLWNHPESEHSQISWPSAIVGLAGRDAEETLVH
jgi:hypothetical protein